ncbi:MinD/ParA family ATP-binding protein [Halobacteriovorax sp. GFR7]|uniref:MinD/ParA family ATP-binding protein n=1 Tax=unclassified Halobacteriovorax TaxID=2639665 RepID=UPI00371A7A7A
MSRNDLSTWLLSHRSDDSCELNVKTPLSYLNEECEIIAVGSGKGGVGKTTTALMIANELSAKGKKVLLIDCDYNLSNTAVKLGLPLNDNFYSLLSLEKSFDECLYKLGNIHLLSGCNGNSDLFDTSFEHDKFIIDIIAAHRSEYDHVILDCPAGVNKETINLQAYADYRFMVVNPDRSSITDTYALIKILNQKYQIKNNHLIVNRVDSNQQYRKVVKSLVDTVASFMQANLSVLGGVKNLEIPSDKFDHALLKTEKNSLSKYYTNIINKFTDEDSTSRVAPALLKGFSRAGSNPQQLA